MSPPDKKMKMSGPGPAEFIYNNNGHRNNDFEGDLGMLKDSDEKQPKVLYVGNLDSQATEEYLVVLFGQIGKVESCKMVNESSADPYAFIEFLNHNAAASALASMNKRNCFGKDLKVNWATSHMGQTKLDTSKHHHIFVGDLSPEIESQALREAFTSFGEISDCRVVRDPQTLKSKGYGFVSFIKKSEAETAISGMNGQWVGNRSIRTNWAARNPSQSQPKSDTATNSKKLQFDEVYNQASATNCTVYCGGITTGLTEELMQKSFSPFGQIQEIRVFKDKGYSFIKFATKQSATHSIVAVHNTEINEQVVKCSWGKETGDPANQNQTQHLPFGLGASSFGAATTAQYQYPIAHQMGYWYPQAQAQATAYPDPATAQIQNEFLQQRIRALQQGMQQQGMAWDQNQRGNYYDNQ